MGRIQIALTAIAVIAIVSLAMNIAILIRSGDGPTGPVPGQFGIEEVGESLGAQLSEDEERELEEEEERQQEEEEEE